MSCPEWRRLDPAARDAPAASASATKVLEAARWQEALRHLESGCPRCWQEALAVDPTLVFRRLPAAELGPAQEAAEIESARLAVQAMRTASRLEHPPLAARRSRRALHALPSHHAARWALAAGLTAMALVFGSAGHTGHTGSSWRAAQVSPPGTAAASVADLASSDFADRGGAGLAAPTRFIRADSPAALGAVTLPASSRPSPSIEGLSRPEARVYQLDGPHMSVVMIVDAKLDV